jgi:hypothetical protein
MGRTRGVKYYESRGAYFTNIGGTQHRLATGPKDEPAGPTYTEALAKFRELHELLSAEQAGDRNPVPRARGEIPSRSLHSRQASDHHQGNAYP